jgi:hypothetical protein
MKQREIQAVESFITNFDQLIKDLEAYSGYLRLGNEAEKLREDALDILKKKVKKMKKAKDEDELKKVLRLKKVYEKSGVR